MEEGSEAEDSGGTIGHAELSEMQVHGRLHRPDVEEHAKARQEYDILRQRAAALSKKAVPPKPSKAKAVHTAAPQPVSTSHLGG